MNNSDTDKSATRIRVVIAKPGLDGHDRGARVVANAFKDAGMEVIYLGLQQTPEMIVNAAIEEDADVIALSILSGAHMTLFPKVLRLLEQHGAQEILVTGGGISSEEDMKKLQEMGTGRLFGPGAALDAAIEYVREEIAARRKSRSV